MQVETEWEDEVFVENGASAVESDVAVAKAVDAAVTAAVTAVANAVGIEG